MSNEAETVIPDLVPPGVPPETVLPIIVIEGNRYMRAGDGSLVPIENIRAQDLLMDETVRKIMHHVLELQATMIRFKDYTFGDVAAFQELLAQEYKTTVGGIKGNVQLSTFDDTMRVSVHAAQVVEFGSELQHAKQLIDKCLMRWGAESNANLRAIVNRAFLVDQQGKISQANLYMMLRYEINDPDWQDAMKAIRDSIRPKGTKKYLRFQRRESSDDAWVTISLDMASV